MSINIFPLFVADYINSYYFMVVPSVGFVGNILSFFVSFRICKSTTPSTGTTYLVGVALDRFPIFVTVNEGKVIAETGLDECGGKVGYNCAFRVLYHTKCTIITNLSPEYQ